MKLIEELINIFSIDKEHTILDFTAGSFSTGVACVNTGRKFIGIESGKYYFEIGKKRIEESLNKEVF